MRINAMKRFFNFPVLVFVRALALFFSLCLPAWAEGLSETDTAKLSIFIISLILVILLFTFFGIQWILNKFALERTGKASMVSLKPGLALVQGRALDFKPLETPLTRKPCVYFWLEIRELRREGLKIEEDIKVWVESKQTFYIEDPTGSVSVNAEKADLSLRAPKVIEVETQKGFSQEEGDLIGSYNLPIFDAMNKGIHYKITEKSIAPGTLVYVAGICGENPAPPPGASLPPFRHGRGKFGFRKQAGKLFIVSDMDPMAGFRGNFPMAAGLLLAAPVVVFLLVKWLLYLWF
jgi:hypothetical protein